VSSILKEIQDTLKRSKTPFDIKSSCKNFDLIWTRLYYKKGGAPTLISFEMKIGKK